MHTAIVWTISLRSMRLFYNFWVLKFAPLCLVYSVVGKTRLCNQLTVKHECERSQCAQKYHSYFFLWNGKVCTQALASFFLRLLFIYMFCTHTTETRDEQKWQINFEKIRTKTSWRHHKMLTTMIMDGFIQSTASPKSHRAAEIFKQFNENYFIVFDDFSRIKWYFRIRCLRWQQTCSLLVVFAHALLLLCSAKCLNGI